MKILVVDDEIALAENVAEVLVSVGHDAEVATSAEEALDRLSADATVAEILLTDYRLPGATGVALIDTLRRLGNRIPALVVTAYQDEQIAASAKRVGAADVLTKPIDFARLLSWVATATVQKS